MNKILRIIPKTQLIITSLTILSFFVISAPSRAELIYKDANGKEFYKGKLPNRFHTGKLGKCPPIGTKGSVMDSAGNIFTLECIMAENGAKYYEGTINTVSSTIDFKWGSCLFVEGINVFNFEVDENNNFKEIEWISIKPKDGFTTKEIADGVLNKKGEDTEIWYPKAIKFLTDNKFTYQPFIQPIVTTESSTESLTDSFSVSTLLGNQTISLYEEGQLISEVELTPEEALIAYDRNSDGTSPTVPMLNINPNQGIPGSPEQETLTSVPEFSSPISFLFFGTLGLSFTFKHKLKPS